MPDHWHLIVWPRTDGEFSRLVERDSHRFLTFSAP